MNAGRSPVGVGAAVQGAPRSSLCPALLFTDTHGPTSQPLRGLSRGKGDRVGSVSGVTCGGV